MNDNKLKELYTIFAAAGYYEEHNIKTLTASSSTTTKKLRDLIKLVNIQAEKNKIGNNCGKCKQSKKGHYFCSKTNDNSRAIYYSVNHKATKLDEDDYESDISKKDYEAEKRPNKRRRCSTSRSEIINNITITTLDVSTQTFFDDEQEIYSATLKSDAYTSTEQIFDTSSTTTSTTTSTATSTDIDVKDASTETVQMNNEREDYELVRLDVMTIKRAIFSFNQEIMENKHDVNIIKSQLNTLDFSHKITKQNLNDFLVKSKSTLDQIKNEMHQMKTKDIPTIITGYLKKFNMSLENRKIKVIDKDVENDSTQWKHLVDEELNKIKFSATNTINDFVNEKKHDWQSKLEEWTKVIENLQLEHIWIDKLKQLEVFIKTNLRLPLKNSADIHERVLATWTNFQIQLAKTDKMKIERKDLFITVIPI